MRLTDTLRFARDAATGTPLRTVLSVLAMSIGVAAVVIAGDPSLNGGMNFCGQPGSCGCNGLDCGVFHADRLYQFTGMLAGNGYAADLCKGTNSVPLAVKTALTEKIDLACMKFDPPS